MTQRESTLLLARVIYYCSRGIIDAIKGKDSELVLIDLDDAWEEIAEEERRSGDELRGRAA